MKNNMLRVYPRSWPGPGVVAVLALVLAMPAVGAELVEDLIRRTDRLALSRLAVLQAAAPQPPLPFTSDGCSGGLSSGWRYLAGVFPQLGSRFGDTPPWEACCVRHDRAYWAGRAEGGYVARKQADLQLKQCVIQMGEVRAPGLARQYGLKAGDVTAAWRVAAESMYWAVRTGGQACSPFAWRWGYGWPPCPLMPAPISLPAERP